MTPTSAQQARRSFHWRSLAVALLALAVGVFLAWLVFNGKPKPVASSPPAPPTPQVQILVAEPSTMTLPVMSQGIVQAAHDITLTAQIAGKVVSVASNYADGAHFTRGDSLLSIEAADYEYAVVRAEAAVAAAEQRLAEERGRARQAQREWRDLGSEEANALFLREPQLRAAEASLAAAKADRAAAKLALSRTVVRAPFDGRIETRLVDLGQVINAGTPIAEIYATEKALVKLPLTLTQVHRLGLASALADDIERPVLLSADIDGKTYDWRGVIRRLSARVDRKARMIEAIAEVDQPFVAVNRATPVLTPGLFVRAQINTAPVPHAVQLPLTALRADDSILVVSTEGRLQRQAVTVLRRDALRAVVTGVAAGARVVAVRSPLLVDGVLVETMPYTPANAEQAS